MPHIARNTPDLSSNTGFEPLFTMSTALATSVAQLQRLQLDAWLSWQKSMVDSTQELFDEWACRFGGGVPIDG